MLALCFLTIIIRYLLREEMMLVDNLGNFLRVASTVAREPEAAALRELEEETNIKSVRIVIGQRNGFITTTLLTYRHDHLPGIIVDKNKFGLLCVSLETKTKSIWEGGVPNLMTGNGSLKSTIAMIIEFKKNVYEKVVSRFSYLEKEIDCNLHD